MTIGRPSKLTVGAFLLSMMVFLPSSTVNADYEAPAYVEEISAPLSIPSYSVGAQFQNRQIAGTEFCASGGFLYILKDPYSIDSTGMDDGWTAGTLLLSVSDTDGGATTLNLLDLVNAEGAGYYGAFSNNSIGCPLAEDPVIQGSSYAFFYVNNDGIATYYENPAFGATSTPDYYAPTVPINKNIEILNPTYGTTTATTTFAITINYKTPFSLDFRPTTTRHYEIVDALTGELQYVYNYTLEPNTGENMQLNATATAPIGSKYIRAMYLDTNGGVYSEIDEVFFNVATNTYKTATGLDDPRQAPGTLTQIDCGLFEFGCQIQKAMTFLFKPSENTLDKFSNLWQTIAEKKPFGYVTVTIRQLGDLDETGAQAFDLGSLPFMSAIFTPFRDAIAGILWALFAIYFLLHRLRHIDI